MQEPIFKVEDNVKEFGDSILAFKDCPYKCVDGFYVDPYKHKKIKCPHCSDLRKKLAREQISVGDVNLEEMLKLPKAFSEYNEDVIIPSFARKKLDEDSVVSVLSILNSLISDISVGVYTDYSMIFNLGALCHEESFISTYLTRAYMSGLTVSPVYSSYEVIKLRQASEGGRFRDSEDLYENILNSDVCILYLDVGSPRDSIMSIMGVVQLRAYRNRATIVFTKTPPTDSKFDYSLCPESDKCKSMLVYYGIKYNKKYQESETKYRELTQSSKPITEPKYMPKNSFNNLTKPINNI